jgi:hypothetical protein
MSLEELEISRKKTLIASGVLYFLAGVLFLFGLGFPGILLPLLAQLMIKTFQVGLKKALVTPLAEALGFRYSPEQGFPEEEALTSGLFSSPDGYDAEDLVEGEVNGIPFASSDITLYRKVRVRIGNASFDHYLRFFRGTLYRFHLPFPIEGEVRFGPRGRGMGVADRRALFIGAFMVVITFLAVTAGVLFGGLGIRDALPLYILLPLFFFFASLASMFRRKGGYERPKRVVLESPEFERLFDVYGEDQVEVRKVLTPRLQEALVRLRKYLGKPIWGVVRGNDLWLLVKGRDRFLVPVLRPVSEIIETWKTRYQEELLEVSRVAEMLKLEEEAKRRGVWWRKTFVGQNEPPPAPEKENDTFGGDEWR